MNRIILVGNGFDLAHSLKTDYNSFIIWYLTKCFGEAYGNRIYEDELISIQRRHYYTEIYLQPFSSTAQYINYFYNNGFAGLNSGKIKLNEEDNHTYNNTFHVVFNSGFLETLLTKCNDKNWVDIENEFYERLKNCYDDLTPKIEEIDDLNKSLESIIQQLERYLSTIKCEKYLPEYSDIFNSEIKIGDIIKSGLTRNIIPNNTLILNFNYTDTVNKYLEPTAPLPAMIRPINLNHIHGEVNNDNNKLIFGFGDELDDYYKKMEDSKTNGVFKHIKSFGYFKTTNYHDLINFIEDDNYQIYILGHSCGLSDRTLLSMLFEHSNCKSIKIYYYVDGDKNNFTHLTQEVSRHFKDKNALRRKIVPFPKCDKMPQIQ